MNDKGLFDGVGGMMLLVYIIFILAVIVMPVSWYFIGHDNSGKIIYIPESGVECLTMHESLHSFGRPSTYDMMDCSNGKAYFDLVSYSSKKKGVEVNYG